MFLITLFWNINTGMVTNIANVEASDCYISKLFQVYQIFEILFRIESFKLNFRK